MSIPTMALLASMLMVAGIRSLEALGFGASVVKGSLLPGDRWRLAWPESLGAVHCKYVKIRGRDTAGITQKLVLHLMSSVVVRGRISKEE